MKYKIISILIMISLVTHFELQITLPLSNRNISLESRFRICQAAQWKEMRSSHFIIYYKQASKDFLYKLRRIAEDYYRDILDDLGFRRSKFWTWENRAKIYLFDSNKEYCKETSMSSWSGASVDYRNKIINTYPDAPGFFDNILVHELTHIIFREYVGFDSDVPLWLDEGVAMFMEKRRGASLFIRQLDLIEAAGDLFNLKELTAINQATTFSEHKAKIFYVQSFSLVHFFIQQFGRDTFSKFCYLLRQGKSLEKSLWLAYYIRGLDDLEAKWQQYYFD